MNALRFFRRNADRFRDTIFRFDNSSRPSRLSTSPHSRQRKESVSVVIDMTRYPASASPDSGALRESLCPENQRGDMISVRSPNFLGHFISSSRDRVFAHPATESPKGQCRRNNGEDCGNRIKNRTRVSQHRQRNPRDRQQ